MSCLVIMVSLKFPCLGHHKSEIWHACLRFGPGWFGCESTLFFTWGTWWTWLLVESYTFVGSCWPLFEQCWSTPHVYLLLWPTYLLMMFFYIFHCFTLLHPTLLFIYHVGWLNLCLIWLARPWPESPSSTSSSSKGRCCRCSWAKFPQDHLPSGPHPSYDLLIDILPAPKN